MTMGAPETEDMAMAKTARAETFRREVIISQTAAARVLSETVGSDGMSRYISSSNEGGVSNGLRCSNRTREREER